MKDEKPTKVLDREEKNKAEDMATKWYAKVDDNGKVQIPKKVMEFLKVEPGDKLNIELEGLNGNVIVITKA